MLFKNTQKDIFLIHIPTSAAHGLRLLIESAWLYSSLVHGSERADFNSSLQVHSVLPFPKTCLNHSLISYLDKSDLDYFQYSLVGLSAFETIKHLLNTVDPWSTWVWTARVHLYMDIFQ